MFTDAASRTLGVPPERHCAQDLVLGCAESLQGDGQRGLREECEEVGFEGWVPLNEGGEDGEKGSRREQG